MEVLSLLLGTLFSVLCAVLLFRDNLSTIQRSVALFGVALGIQFLRPSVAEILLVLNAAPPESDGTHLYLYFWGCFFFGGIFFLIDALLEQYRLMSIKKP